VARRIAVAALALITLLLAVVAIPLGLLISAQDRRDFQSATTTAAVTVANVAEERLDDGGTARPWGARSASWAARCRPPWLGPPGERSAAARSWPCACSGRDHEAAAPPRTER